MVEQPEIFSHGFSAMYTRKGSWSPKPEGDNVGKSLTILPNISIYILLNFLLIYMCFNSLTEGGSSYPKESFEPLARLPFTGNTCLFFSWRPLCSLIPYRFNIGSS